MTTTAQSQKLIVPAMAGIYDLGSTIAYPLIRFVAGFWLVPHGAQKLFGMFGGNIQGTAGFFTKIGLEPALPLAYLTGFVEFFGGLLIAIGLLTRPASFAAMFVLLVTVYVHWIVRGEGYGGAEKSILWAAIFFYFTIRGANRHSVDARLGKEF